MPHPLFESFWGFHRFHGIQLFLSFEVILVQHSLDNLTQHSKGLELWTQPTCIKAKDVGLKDSNLERLFRGIWVKHQHMTQSTSHFSKSPNQNTDLSKINQVMAFRWWIFSLGSIYQAWSTTPLLRSSVATKALSCLCRRRLDRTRNSGWILSVFDSWTI